MPRDVTERDNTMEDTPPWPRNAVGVTADWLSSVLGAAVTSVELEATGAAGFVSDTYRAKLSYAGEAGAAAGAAAAAAGRAGILKPIVRSKGSRTQWRFRHLRVQLQRVLLNYPRV